MKYIQFVLIALSLSACVSTPKQAQWVIDYSDKAQHDKLMAVYEECREYAFKAKVAGSKFSQNDIHTACIQQKGYAYRYVEITDAK